MKISVVLDSLAVGKIRIKQTEGIGDDEDGSIAPLIVFLFAVILILTFLASNVAAAYISRRDLVARVETSLASAIRELDEFRYYYGNPLTEFLAQDAIASGELRVPIDCNAAQARFVNELNLSSASSSRDNSVSHRELEGAAVKNAIGRPIIRSITCDGFELLATVSEELPLPFQLRVFGIKSFTNRVQIGSASIYETIDYEKSE